MTNAQILASVQGIVVTILDALQFLVPLAIARPRVDGLWLLTLPFLLAAHVGAVALSIELVLASLIVLRAASGRPRHTEAAKMTATTVPTKKCNTHPIGGEAQPAGCRCARRPNVIGGGWPALA